MHNFSTTTQYANLSSRHLNKNTWLFYVRDNLRLNNNNTFLLEMDRQLRPQYEKKLGLEVDWSKVILFYPPIDSQFVKIEIDGKKCVKLISAQLEITGFKQLNSPFYWYSNTSDLFIYTLEDFLNVKDITFILEDVEKRNIDYVPVKNLDSKLELFLYETNTYFPVLTDSNLLLESNHLIIELNDESELQTIKSIITKVSEKWQSVNPIGLPNFTIYPTIKQFPNYFSLYYEPPENGHDFIVALSKEMNEKTKTIKSILIESSVKQNFNTDDNKR